MSEIGKDGVPVPLVICMHNAYTPEYYTLWNKINNSYLIQIISQQNYCDCYVDIEYFLKNTQCCWSVHSLLHW